MKARVLQARRSAVIYLLPDYWGLKLIREFLRGGFADKIGPLIMPGPVQARRSILRLSCKNLVVFLSSGRGPGRLATAATQARHAAKEENILPTPSLSRTGRVRSNTRKG